MHLSVASHVSSVSTRLRRYRLYQTVLYELQLFIFVARCTSEMFAISVLEKLGIEIKVPPGGIDISQTGVVSTPANSQLTPQILLQKTMEEQVEKVKSATGIELPAYYNPIAVNPTKYAEQIKKRRLLWGNKDKQVGIIEAFISH